MTCLVGCLLVALAAAALAPAARAEEPAERLEFGELYSGNSVLGLQFSPKVQRLEGRVVVMPGFMAPPLKAEASFFVLTKEPVSLCPFCQSDADWPDDIVVVYLRQKESFVQNNRPIMVEGRLETGSRVDEETGFLSRMRLMDARFYLADEDEE